MNYSGTRLLAARYVARLIVHKLIEGETLMKRTLGICSSVAVALAMVFGSAGCADTTKTTETKKLDTPNGTVEKKVTEEVKKTGDMKDDKAMEPKK